MSKFATHKQRKAESRKGVRTESWTDRRISMYTYEERMRAIQTYMDSGFRLTRTISQLGYPTHQALRNWYKEYKENGGLHQKFKRDPIHTEQQKLPECIFQCLIRGLMLLQTTKRQHLLLINSILIKKLCRHCLHNLTMPRVKICNA